MAEEEPKHVSIINVKESPDNEEEDKKYERELLELKTLRFPGGEEITIKSWGKRNIKIRRSSPFPEDQSEVDLDHDVEKESRSRYDHFDKALYLSACQSLGVVPVSYFLRHINETKMNLAHHGIGTTGAKAIVLSLMSNTKVLELDLSDNWLEGKGGEHVAYLLTENLFITDLNVANNHIGSRGIEALCKMLQSNTTLKSINVSGNGLTDNDAVFMGEAIKENNRLKEFDMSHNYFSDKAGVIFGKSLAENETIEELNLSWNAFRLKGGVELCMGISQNNRLQIVNLAMNGLGNEGALGVAEMIKQSTTLTDLDISSNRIGLPGASAIAKALEGNELLKEFKMGHNPIGVDGAKILLKVITAENSRLVLKCFDISGVDVDKEFRDMKLLYLATKKINISHGAILGDYVLGQRKKTPVAMMNLRVELLHNLIHEISRQACSRGYRCMKAQPRLRTPVELCPCLELGNI